MRLVYIHGANSTPRSFRFIQAHLPEHELLNLEYHVDCPFVLNEERFKDEISDFTQGKEFSLIGHSMGGLFSVRILNTMQKARNAFTMSAPYGGSKFVNHLLWICPGYQLFKDIKTSSEVIRYFQSAKNKKPILQIVTSGGGNPLMGEPNDGTVTVASQKNINNVAFLEKPLNHFEVLMDEETVTIMQDFLAKN